MQNRPEDLILRIETLERKNRGLSWLLFGLAAIMAGPFAGSGVAAQKGTVLEANQFVLRDDEGTKRGEVLVGPDGGGRIVLYGSDGRPVAELPMTTQAFPLRH